MSTTTPETQADAFSTEQLTGIAELARLTLAPEQHAELAAQFASILSYVDMLNSVNTDTVEPLYSPSLHTPPVRVDEARATLTKQELFANAPETDGDFFIVPKIV